MAAKTTLPFLHDDVGLPRHHGQRHQNRGDRRFGRGETRECERDGEHARRGRLGLGQRRRRRERVRQEEEVKDQGQ